MYLFWVPPAKFLPSRQLTLVLDFIYNGEVDVMQDDLDLFLNAAIDLKVQGLTPASPGQASDDLTSTPDSMPSTPPPIQITHDRQHSNSRSPPSADRSSRPQFQSPISPTPASDLLSPSSSTSPDAETDPGLVVKTELIEPSSSDIEERESTWRPKNWSDLRRFITRLANDETLCTLATCAIKDPRRAATYTNTLKLLTSTALSNIPAATVTKNSRTDIDLTTTPLGSTGLPKLRMQTRKVKSKGRRLKILRKLVNTKNWKTQSGRGLWGLLLNHSAIWDNLCLSCRMRMEGGHGNAPYVK